MRETTSEWGEKPSNSAKGNASMGGEESEKD